MSRTTYFHGWKPDEPDRRDRAYLPKPSVLRSLPSFVDLRHDCPGVYDQKSLHSCTANAVAAALEFAQMRQGLPRTRPSRLFLYYNARKMEGTAHLDSGAQIRNAIKVAAAQGACSEKTWPYRVPAYGIAPPGSAYHDALHDRALVYARLRRSIDHLQACLAQGHPFVFGMNMYESFESGRVYDTGTAHVPRSHEKHIGGHAVLAVGYSQAHRRFIVRNSWGPDWGRRGYFTLPYDYFLTPDLAKNFWTIRMMAEPRQPK